MRDLEHIGVYVTTGSSKAPYRAHVPPKLPIPIDMEALYPKLDQAMVAIARLNSIADAIPNKALFSYMFVRKEALLSSQIEGTQSSLSDLVLFENDQKPMVEYSDVEEVSNYVKAIQHGLKRLEEGFPLSLRLIREMHGILLSGVRGMHETPGEFRRSQNWIGGTNPNNALFVPPPVDHLMDCLSNFEAFLHVDSLPSLIKFGIAHVQFETIHPFLDGNGRLGRLLIILQACHGGMLSQPVLYLSLYFKKHRKVYYALLQEVREHSRWEVWLEFFLEAIIVSSQQAIQAAHEMNKIFAEDLEKISSLKRAAPSAQAAFSYLMQVPQVSVKQLAESIQLSAPAARSTLKKLMALKIVEPVSAKQRDQIYIYRRYVDLLEAGADPL